MAETFNPILREATVPTDEVGVLGRRKAQPQDPEFEDMPATAIVIHQPSGSADEDSYVLLQPKHGLSGVRLNSESRYFRIDLGERVITWQLEAPSSDANLLFTVKLLTTFAVTDARTIAMRGVRDVRSQVNTTLTETIRSAVAAFELADGAQAAAAIEHSVTGHVFDCGVEVRAAYALVAPNSWAAERVATKQQQAHERELDVLKYQFERDRDQLRAERERVAQEHQRLLDEQLARFTADQARAQDEYELEHQRLSEPRAQELDRLKAETELATLQQQAKLDATREEERRAREHAERDAEHARQQFEQQVLSEQKQREAERERLQAEHEAALAKIRQTTEREHELLQAEHDAALARILQTTEREHENAELERDRKRHQEELQEAALINDQIAADPSKIMGFLLSLGDREPAKVAFKMLEDRQKVTWDRFKDLQKLNVLPESTLRSLALALMRDPAGGAFGLDGDMPIDDESGDQTEVSAA